jgi:hypothetical protein
MWNNFVTRGEKTSVNGEGRSKKSKQNKAEQELKASDGHHILFTFIGHAHKKTLQSPRRRRRSRRRRRRNRGMVLSFSLSQI